MPSSTSTPAGQPRNHLPGLNLPLNRTPHAAYTKTENSVKTEIPAQGDGKDLFRTALSDADVMDGKTALALITLREITMLEIMNELTDKEGWEEKVFDDTISQKWKAEALSAPGRDVTENMANWVIDELRCKAQIFKQVGAVSIFNGDVVKSDTAIPKDLQKSLKLAARKLEDIPEIFKDYHPGSDGQVLDLVHPSLFPLIYGRSRVLEDIEMGLDDCVQRIGEGKVIPMRAVEEQLLDRKGCDMSSINSWTAEGDFPKPYSRNFQWLPCDVDISGEDGSAKIISYINNLHPQKHHDLYKVIEEVISKAIPLWNMTLTPLKTKHVDPTNPYLIDYSHPPRIQVEKINFDPDEDLEALRDRTPKESDEEEWYYEARLLGARRLIKPDAGAFQPPAAPDNLENVDLRRDYSYRGLQVIVKLANIELTPEKPEYGGGAWHVEGQMNEHICATALYYYDTQNITPSRLSFRQQSNTDFAHNIEYEQYHWDWLETLYGCKNEESAVQEVGSVLCREGRLVIFPNILQHRAQPFKLEDPTKRGHRKILALFLVDPGIRIIGTSNVLPQQKEWWFEEVVRQMEGSGKALAKLSQELREQVFEGVEGWPMSIEEAKEVRLRLMDERKVFVSEHTRITFEGYGFGLCEH